LDYFTSNNTEQVIDQAFWIHECIKTTNKDVPPVDNRRFNKIVAVKYGQAGNVVRTIGILGFITLLVIIAPNAGQ